MILRRINAHLKQQSWLALVLDLIVVVVGVFIGIQVSNWNADRLEAQKGAVFTERLKACYL